TPSVYSHIIPGWDALQLTTKKLPPAPPALTCQEPGCTRRLYGRGCCRSHYDQYYPPSTRAKYRPWTHDEDLIALDPAISIKSATTYIRRTQAACNRRRAMIRNRHPDRYQEILMEIHESRTVDLQDQVRAELAEFAAEHGYDQGSYAAGSFADEYAAEVTENLLDWPDAAPTYDFSPPRHLRDELEDDITWTGSAKVSDLLAKAAASKR
ncbi:hypothetical protein, partial [Gulosibacter sp. 10]|uniref:hypothetical protein n=1 Tax=Gulosibacter sp. 10 TaxID=1255570 RepID=UPI001595AEF7